METPAAAMGGAIVPLTGYFVAQTKLQLVLTITSGKLRRRHHWFNCHGHHIVFWGRLVPILRTLVSIPAGIELMPLRSFLLWTSLGRMLWNILLTVLGYSLGQYWTAAHAMLRPLTLLAAGGLAGFAIWFLFLLGRGRQAGR